MNRARNGQTQQWGNTQNEATIDRIRELSFVKNELELYLDTHPRCKVALDYYYKTVDALKKLTDEYNAKGAPITACAATNTEEWTWTAAPWPWHRDSDAKMLGEGK